MSDNDPTTSHPQSQDEALANFKQSLDSELDRFFDEATIEASKQPKKSTPRATPQIEVTNFGKIARILMPPGWLEGKPEPDEANPKRRLRQFHSPENENVKICLYFRGNKISEESGAEFQKVLTKSPHMLAPAEFKLLSDVLSADKTDQEKFKSIAIATKDLNGIRSLVAEGRHLVTEQDIYAIYIDADGSGLVVQEIYFQGPKTEYLRFHNEALIAIRSVEWKDGQS